MDQWWLNVLDFLQSDRAIAYVQAALKVGVGFVLGQLARRQVPRLLGQLDSNQQVLLARISFYGLWGLFIASALSDLGFNLGILLGAAGILTVAIGFASQTSASNIISGVFLLGEKPFVVGDVIRIGSTTGEVVSIDLLSVKLRTFDNLFVRIPNETMIKSEITNLQRYPIRRYDLQVGVAYKEDIPRVREVLMAVADANPLCLDEPQPLIIFRGFGQSSIDHQFSVWAKTENFLQLRNTIPAEVHAAFEERGIEIPFPHRSLYTGSVTDPLPIQLVNGGSADRDANVSASSPSEQDAA